MKKVRIILLMAVTVMLLGMPALADEAAAPSAEYEGTPTTAMKAPTAKLGVSVGAFMGSFVAPGSGTPVGLEHDGMGNLYMTEIGTDTLYQITTTGAVLNSWGGMIGNPIGVTSDGSFYYVTDTVNQAVQIYALNGTPVTSFSVAAYTTFPEGITYCPNNGHLYVVGGSGENIVIEYMTDGTAVTTYPILGSSPDGIAWDPMRQCFWLYDSGTDTVRQYDTMFSQVDSFPGTVNAGFSTGEGLAVIGNSVYVVATGSDRIVEFDITYAQGSFDMCIQSPDGSAVFNFNSTTGMFQYCDDYGTISGAASVSISGCHLMIRGMSDEGHWVIATAEICSEMKGSVIIRVDKTVALAMSPFIRNGTVTMSNCPCN